MGCAQLHFFCVLSVLSVSFSGHPRQCWWVSKKFPSGNLLATFVFVLKRERESNTTSLGYEPNVLPLDYRAFFNKVIFMSITIDWSSFTSYLDIVGEWNWEELNLYRLVANQISCRWKTTPELFSVLFLISQTFVVYYYCCKDTFPHFCN